MDEKEILKRLPIIDKNLEVLQKEREELSEALEIMQKTSFACCKQPHPFAACPPSIYCMNCGKKLHPKEEEEEKKRIDLQLGSLQSIPRDQYVTPSPISKKEP